MLRIETQIQQLNLKAKELTNVDHTTNIVIYVENKSLSNL